VRAWKGSRGRGKERSKGQGSATGKTNDTGGREKVGREKSRGRIVFGENGHRTGSTLILKNRRGVGPVRTTIDRDPAPWPSNEEAYQYGKRRGGEEPSIGWGKDFLQKDKGGER